MFRKDNFRFGILLGFLAPIVGLITFYFIRFYSNGSSFLEYLSYLRQYRVLLTGLSSASLMANAVVFTVYINSHKDQTAKGIFLATIVYGVAVLLLKLT